MRLLIGGSPCTYWSIAQTKNRETKPEGLGWELFKNYLIALEKFNPDFFLYENNKSMNAAIREQITRELGVEPILINSSLVSAQNRQRLYWTNIPGVKQPEDRGIVLRDILDSGLPLQEKGYTLKANYAKSGAVNAMDSGHFPAPMAAEPVNITADGKAQCLRAAYYKDGIRNMVGNTVDRKTCVAEPIRIGVIDSDAQGSSRSSRPYRVYSEDGKAVALCGQGGGAGAVTGLYATSVRVGDMPNADGEISGSQSRRVYSIDGKSVPLQSRPNGGGADGAATGLYAMPAQIDEYIFISGETTGAGDVEFIGGFAKKDGTKWLEDGKAFSRNFNQGKRLHGVNKKSVTLTAQGAGLAGHTGLYAVPLNCDGSICSNKSYPVYEVRNGQITIKGRQYPIKLADGFYVIRKLTVSECRRLQTVPEDYIFPVSNTQAYKMLGNGWTCDVISHILSHCPNISSDPLTVLSMYDGMSCGRIALNKLGAHVDRYFATEIDKYAIKTSQANFPDIIHLGDAFQVREDAWGLPDVD